jgi:hypothetical protein
MGFYLLAIKVALWSAFILKHYIDLYSFYQDRTKEEHYAFLLWKSSYS